MDTIKKVQANFTPEPAQIGLLRVMFDPRMTLSQQVSAQLEQHFGDKVFRTVIPRNVRLAEAPSYGLPGVVFDAASRGARAYMEFGAEMAARYAAKPDDAAKAAKAGRRPLPAAALVGKFDPAAAASSARGAGAAASLPDHGPGAARAVRVTE